MIKKVSWMLLWAWLALGAVPGFAAPTAIISGTPDKDGIVQCVYTDGTKVEDGSISITCAAAGTTGLKAKLSGTSGCTYAEADVDKDGAINIRCNDKKPQTISVSNVPATLGVGATVTISATASSGLPVIFSSITPLRCTVSGSTVTAVSVGGCAIETIQAGNSIYSLKEDFQHFDITVGAQTITFGSAPTVIVGGTGSVSATASSGLAVTLSSSTPSICTLSGSTVTGIASGTCTITANQAGDSSYSAAPQATQNINVTTAPVRTAKFTTGGSSGCTYSSVIADENGFTITCSTKTGTPTATLIGTDGCAYTAADVDINGSLIVICNGHQKITFGTAPTVMVGGTGTVSATASSGLTVTFTSSTPLICTVSGSTVSGVAAGICTIAAADRPDNSVTQSFNVTAVAGQTAQKINFIAAPTTISVGGTGIVSATGGASGLPVIFNTSSTGFCTISGSTVTGVAVGTCTITANQAGNSNYSPAPEAILVFQITAKTVQKLTFGPKPMPIIAVGETGTVSVTASNGPVTFSSRTESICTVSGNTVKAEKDGLCIIKATDTSGGVAEQRFCVGSLNVCIVPMIRLLSY